MFSMKMDVQLGTGIEMDFIEFVEVKEILYIVCAICRKRQYSLHDIENGLGYSWKNLISLTIKNFIKNKYKTSSIILNAFSNSYAW